MSSIMRVVFLALDAIASRTLALEAITGIMEGPMEKFMAGVKLNDLLHAQWGGPTFVGDIIRRWPTLRVFADLKEADIADTNVHTLAQYCEFGADRLLATVSLSVSARTFTELEDRFPELTVIGMGVPTDMTTEECLAKHRALPPTVLCRWYDVVWRHCKNAGREAAIKHVIASADMLPMVRRKMPEVTPITPGIRDRWMLKQGQVRTTGVGDALRAGAGYVVLGNQLLNGNKEAGITALTSQQMTADLLEAYFAEQRVA